MYSTKGDVVLTNISRETKYFHDLVQYPKEESSSSFLSLGNVLSMFLNWGHVSVSCSYRKCSYKKVCIPSIFSKPNVVLYHTMDCLLMKIKFKVNTQILSSSLL